MRVAFLGHSSFSITDQRGIRVIIDPFPDVIGIKFPPISAQVVVVTHDHFDHNAVHQVSGDFEVLIGPIPSVVHEITFSFFPCFHDDANGVKAGLNQIVRWKQDGLTLVHLGDLGHMLDSELVSLLHRPDLLFVPIGGCGSTLDSARAGKVVAQLEPRIVVPMHFKQDGVRMHLDPIDPFLVGRQCIQAPELDLRLGALPEQRTVAVLDRYQHRPEEAA